MSSADNAEEAGTPPRRRTRAESVRAAIASTEIAGGSVSKETRTLMAEWAEGKLTHDELLDAVKRGQDRQHLIMDSADFSPSVLTEMQRIAQECYEGDLELLGGLFDEDESSTGSDFR